MCLGVPGKIISLTQHDSLLRMGVVDFSGLKKEVNLTYLPEAKIGDYVIVHVGFAISCIDPTAAAETFRYLQEVDPS